MFFTMCLGCRNKGVEDFSVAYSRTTHITAIGVVLAGKKAWSQPERGPFCLAHWSEGQTLALHNQQVLSYFWAFPGHFCRTRWWREAAVSFPSQTVLKWQLQNCRWDQQGKGSCSLVTNKSIFFPPTPSPLGQWPKAALTPSPVGGRRRPQVAALTTHTHTHPTEAAERKQGWHR